jgi:hypothetical protein
MKSKQRLVIETNKRGRKVMSHKKAKQIRKALKLKGVDFRQVDYVLTNIKTIPYIDTQELKLAKDENPEITHESLMQKVVKTYNTCTLVLEEGLGRAIYRQTKREMKTV